MWKNTTNNSDDNVVWWCGQDGLWHDEAGDCVRRRVCEINRGLAVEYGVPGRIFGTLLRFVTLV